MLWVGDFYVFSFLLNTFCIRSEDQLHNHDPDFPLTKADLTRQKKFVFFGAKWEDFFELADGRDRGCILRWKKCVEPPTYPLWETLWKGE